MAHPLINLHSCCEHVENEAIFLAERKKVLNAKNCKKKLNRENNTIKLKVMTDDYLISPH